MAGSAGISSFPALGRFRVGVGSLSTPAVVLADLLEVLEHTPGLGRIEAADGNPSMDYDKISRLGLRHAGKADTPTDARKLHDATSQLLLRPLSLDHLTRNT
jgi:hypothetical protein